MPIDPTLPPRLQGVLCDVSLFPFDSSEKGPARIAQKMLHQPEQSGVKRVIVASQLDPTKKRHLEEIAGSTFHKKMRKEGSSAPDRSVSKPKAVRKKRKVVRYWKPVFREWGFEAPQNKCDRARKYFFKSLLFESMTQGNRKWATNNVYVVASGLLDSQKRRSLKIQAFLWIKTKNPAACVRFHWVNIHYGQFYTSENFKIMEDALYDIPFHSKIFIHEGNQLICGQEQKSWGVKKPRKSIADKVIVFDPQGSPAIYKLFKNFQLKNPHIPHHYITTGSSLEPFNRLTSRTQVYFSNKNELALQSAKMLTARGFRVSHSLKK